MTAATCDLGIFKQLPKWSKNFFYKGKGQGKRIRDRDRRRERDSSRDRVRDRDLCFCHFRDCCYFLYS